MGPSLHWLIFTLLQKRCRDGRGFVYLPYPPFSFLVCVFFSLHATPTSPFIFNGEPDSKLMSIFQLVPARCRVKVPLRHTYMTLPQVTLHIVRLWCSSLFKTEEKKRNEIHFLSLALTLTLTCTMQRKYDVMQLLSCTKHEPFRFLELPP